MKRLILILFLLAPSLLAVDYGEEKLIDGGRDDKGRQWIGIEFTLDGGWKTYWRRAGQNGLDPVFDFSASKNLDLSSVKFHWPQPHLIGESDLPAIGYDESFILPISFEPLDGASPIDLKLHAQLGVCKDVCIPIEESFDKPLNRGYSLDGLSLQNAAQNAFDDGAFCSQEGYELPDAGWVLIEDKSENTSSLAKANRELVSFEYPHEMRIYHITNNGIKKFNNCEE